MVVVVVVDITFGGDRASDDEDNETVRALLLRLLPLSESVIDRLLRVSLGG